MKATFLPSLAAGRWGVERGMAKPLASEVIASEHGLVVIGTRGPGTRVWFQPAGDIHFHEVVLPFEPPREAPAALLPGGRLLIIGRNGQSMVIEAGRSPQPGPVLRNVVVEGLSADLVAFARGPHFFRFVAGAWVDETPKLKPAAAALDLQARLHAMRGVAAAGHGFAVGDDGDVWVAAASGWKKAPAKTRAPLRCASGHWAGGDGVLLERKGKVFLARKLSGDVTAVCPWKKGALVVVGETLFDHLGKPVKNPGRVTSISARGEHVYCVANGRLFESTDAKNWKRRVLPK